MRALPIDMFLMNLEETFPPDSLYYMTKEQAYEELKKATGADFGYDIETWKKWLKENRKLKRTRAKIKK
ncbi:hypothetical protein JY97_16125 [Alkalispirochaeta odontotermitis]|nr:hypothetical protein JY97_16125 [Alkalispirochaeta odontotermitis]CAB1067663.1 hypothetical protein D1AOALGA4SA_89 [Olavius algarvensis Delta 1 endosymbiont]